MAKFTAFDAKKLCKLYRHACKKRDEDKKNKEVRKIIYKTFSTKKHLVEIVYNSQFVFGKNY